MVSISPKAACLSCIVALAVSCSQATPYQPVSASSAVRGGYSHQQIAADLFRVRFHGNALTSRETVEAHLLYRAAKITLEHGGDWFRIIDCQTGHTITNEHGLDPRYRPWYGPAYRYWLPYWHYRLQGRGWLYWNPWQADRFWADGLKRREIVEFEAVADISIAKGPVRQGDPRAYDARSVIAAIGPRVVRPRKAGD